MASLLGLSLLDEKENWTVHHGANGFLYYYNKRTKKSQWEKPTCFRPEEEKQASQDWKQYTTQSGKSVYLHTASMKFSWKLPAEAFQPPEKLPAKPAAKLPYHTFKIRQGSDHDSSESLELAQQRQENENNSENLKDEGSKAFLEMLKE